MTNKEKIKELEGYVQILENKYFQELSQLEKFGTIYHPQWKITANMSQLFKGLRSEFTAELKRLEAQAPHDQYIPLFS